MVTNDDLTMNVPLVAGLLEERDWTWSDLARAMGVSKSTVSRVVKHETRPGRKFIFALKSVFPERRDDELFGPAPAEFSEVA